MNPGTIVKLSLDDSITYVVKGDSVTAPHQVTILRDDEETGLRISLSRSPGDLIIVKEAPVYQYADRLNYRGSRVEVVAPSEDGEKVRVIFLDYKPVAENGERIAIGNDPEGDVLMCDLVLANPLS